MALHAFILVFNFCQHGFIVFTVQGLQAYFVFFKNKLCILTVSHCPVEHTYSDILSIDFIGFSMLLVNEDRFTNFMLFRTI